MVQGQNEEDLLKNLIFSTKAGGKTKRKTEKADKSTKMAPISRDSGRMENPPTGNGSTKMEIFMKGI